MVSKFLRVAQDGGDARMDQCKKMEAWLSAAPGPIGSAASNFLNFFKKGVDATNPAALEAFLTECVVMSDSLMYQFQQTTEGFMKMNRDVLDASRARGDLGDLLPLIAQARERTSSLKGITSAMAMAGMGEADMSFLVGYAIKIGLVPEGEHHDLATLQFMLAAADVGGAMRQAVIGAKMVHDKDMQKAILLPLITYVRFERGKDAVEKTNEIIAALNDPWLMGSSPYSALYDLLDPDTNDASAFVAGLFAMAVIGEGTDKVIKLVSLVSEMVSPAWGKTMKDLIRTLGRFEMVSSAVQQTIFKEQMRVAETHINMAKIHYDWLRDHAEDIGTKRIEQIYTNLGIYWALLWGHYSIQNIVKLGADTDGQTRGSSSSRRTLTAQVPNFILPGIIDMLKSLVKSLIGKKGITDLAAAFKVAAAWRAQHDEMVIMRAFGPNADLQSIPQTAIKQWVEKIQRQMSDFITGKGLGSREFVALLAAVRLDDRSALDTVISNYGKTLADAFGHIIQGINREMTLEKEFNQSFDTRDERAFEGIQADLASLVDVLWANWSSSILQAKASVERLMQLMATELNKFKRGSTPYNLDALQKTMPETLDIFVDGITGEEGLGPSTIDQVKSYLSDISAKVLCNPNWIHNKNNNERMFGLTRNHVVQEIQSLVYATLEVYMIMQRLKTEIAMRKIQVELEYYIAAKSSVVIVFDGWLPAPIMIRLFYTYMEQNQSLKDLRGNVRSSVPGMFDIVNSVKSGLDTCTEGTELAAIWAPLSRTLEAYPDRLNSHIADQEKEIDILIEKNNALAYKELTELRVGRGARR